MSKEAKILGSLLVLTEDSGDDCHATIVAIIKGMLKLLVPELQTHRLGVEPKNEETQSAVHGTRWKSDNPKDKAAFTIALRTMATKLGRKDGFVFFHIDGDRTWKERASSENLQKFEKRVVEPIRAIFMQTKLPTPPEVIAERLRRLHLVMPFYSIESWLYQNTVVAIRIARERYGGEDVATIEQWKQDRTLLDDVEAPKKVICLKTHHNLALAKSGYPAREVAEARRSYRTCIEALAGNEALIELLQQTAASEM